MLDERLVENAIEKTRSFREASRYLNVSYNTFKKYARLYGLWIEGGKNPTGKGIPKMRSGVRRELHDILEGKFNGMKLNLTTLRDRLLQELIFEQKCYNCNYDEQRITDAKSPLLLSFADEDRTNYKKENLSLVCYNCAFMTGGNLVGRKKLHFYDEYTGEIIEKAKLK